MSTPVEDQRAEALRHYKEISSKACHWSGFVEAAIKAYNPTLVTPEAKEETKEKSTIYQTPTGALISLTDYNFLPTHQQKQCVPFEPKYDEFWEKYFKEYYKNFNPSGSVEGNNNDFDKLVYWATHSGWRYCQGGKQCGNTLILKFDHFKEVVKEIRSDRIQSMEEQVTIPKEAKKEFDTWFSEWVQKRERR